MKVLTAIVTSLVMFVMPSQGKMKPPSVSVSPSPTTLTTPSPTLPLVLPEVMEKWTKVAWCETHGNWRADGATFAGGLGISRVVWDEYGGRQYAAHPGLATKEQQILIARAIQARAGVPEFVPDQDGECHGW